MAGQPIPRVIHRLWLGDAPIPELFEHYAETWRRHHPDWEMKLWREGDLPELACQAEFEKANSFKTRYDVVRLELLRQFGGVIIDMDVEALRPIDPLLDGVEAFVGQATYGRRMGNQVLGATARHPLWEHAVRRLRDTVGVASSASQQAGPAFVSQMVREKPDGVTVFPRDTFYSPLTIDPVERPEKYPQFYALHHSTESYREGEEGEVVRLQRRLRDAQKEILRLMNELDAHESRGSNGSANTDLAAVAASRWWRLGRRLGVVKIRI
ncbi:MAG TPA: glycosyltransferase [Thermoleophilaceae bacterium]